MTLSDLISVFEGYATQEDLIFQFEAREQMPNLSNEEEISTDALMQVVISSLNPSFDTTQVNIDFYFLKRLERDRTNYASVMSDTFLLCADFQQYMEVNIAPTQGINISFTNSALPVNNFDLDYTAGVTLSASIVYANDGQCVVPPPPACNPVTYEITDTDDNVLYSGSIPSGGELNQEIQDSTAVLKDTDGNILSTTSILAEGSEDIVAPDAVVNFTYEDGTPLQTFNFPSGSNQDIPLSNASAENSDSSYTASEPYGTTIQLPDITVTDSNGSTYTQPSVTDVFCTPCEDVNLYVGEANVGSFPSGSDVFVKVIQDGLEVIPEDVTVVDDEVSIVLADTVPCADTDLEVNGVSVGSVGAGSTVDVQLSDSGGTVTPDSVTLVGTDLQIVLPDAPPATPRSTATLMKTGLTTSYAADDDGQDQFGRLVDFLTLKEVPLHNDGSPTLNTTTNRFTDTLGGQTYTNTIVLDWSTWDGSTLKAYRRTKSTGYQTWDNARIACSALTIGGFTGWRMTNRTELYNLLHHGVTGTVLNYAPFNITIDTNLWTSTTNRINGNAYGLFSTGNGGMGAATKAAAAAEYIPARTFSLSTSNVLS